MKKIIFLFIISASLITVTGHAQRGQRGTEMKQMLKDSLHLTDAQADSVAAIRAEFRNEMRSLRKDSTISADERKEKLKPLRDEMQTRLQAILTKEQMQKMRQMQQEMRGKGRMDDDN